MKWVRREGVKREGSLEERGTFKIGL